MDDVRKTLIAVLASHDSVGKNNELAGLFNELYRNHKEILDNFHFLFTGGTFGRIVRGKDTHRPPRRDLQMIKKPARDFIKSNATILPDRKEGGITILANLIVQRQCSIVWPFLSPITTHWLNPENLALMRLCDLWNVKRLMNAESVRACFRDEIERAMRRNPQVIPLKITLGTPETEEGLTLPPWPRAEKPRYNQKYYEVRLPDRARHPPEFWGQFERQTIALIAHDAMKDRMVDFAIEYENELCKFGRILATGTTGRDVENACRNLRELKKVRRCLSGPKGGDIEIATEILFGRCHVVVFFIDPLHPHAHMDDIRVVFAACMAEIPNNDVRMLTNEVQAREWIEGAVRLR